MLNFFAKLSLVMTALAPISLVYAWVAFSDGKKVLALVLILACALLVYICILILNLSRKHLERFTFTPSSVEPADRENIAFMLLYLSPLFTNQFGDLNIDILIPTLLVFILLTTTGYNYHFNPLLGLAKWHFYKVSSKEGVAYVIITKKHLRNTGQIKQVAQLTEYILIDLEENNAG